MRRLAFLFLLPNCFDYEWMGLKMGYKCQHYISIPIFRIKIEAFKLLQMPSFNL